MASSDSSSGWTQTQLAVFFVAILLALDDLNPVKIILHVFPSISPWHIAAMCAVLMAYIIMSDVKNLLYMLLNTFLQSIMTIFFRDVEIIGRENIPVYGPVIFTVNHANQFVDGLMVYCTCRRKVSYLMAEASYNRRVIGDFAWAMGVVPVKRAQDYAKKGTGELVMKKKAGTENELVCEGAGTKFTEELAEGDKIRPPGTAFGVKVKSVESDTKIVLDAENLPDDFPLPDKSPVAFDVMKRIPLNVVFKRVLDRLYARGAIGIFPEGGSHDNTDLLPLKVGISLIAYSALEEHGLNVPIVPVGLRYFGAHRWRGRAVVEYGRPVYVDPETLPDYLKGGTARREVCNAHLAQIEDAMRAVIVPAPDFKTLEMIHTARRLYQRNSRFYNLKGKSDAKQDAQARQELTRRFAEGYRRLMLQTDGNPPQEFLDLQARIEAYRDELKDLGLKDYQVSALTNEKPDGKVKAEDVDADSVLHALQIPYHIVHLIVLLAVAAVPTLLLNVPVGVLAGIYAESRRKRALAKSKVKVHAFDVMLTEKIVFCIVMVPTLWILYGILLRSFTEMDAPTLSLTMLCMPLFSYVSIVVTEAGFVSLRDLRPYVMRLFPSTKARLAALPATRKQLQDDLVSFIQKIGPALGNIYSAKELDWKAIQEAARKDQAKKES